MFARMKLTHESKTKYSFAFFYWFDSLNMQLFNEVIFAADFVMGKTVLRMLMALWKSPFQCIHQNGWSRSKNENVKTHRHISKLFSPI